LEAIRDTAQDVHASTGGVYSADPPVLRVISPLAEGSDRLVAQEALALGFELQCPLPFEREEYAHDFHTPESRADYLAMLANATAVLELDGSRASARQENESYETVGRMVLKQSDVLIAIWNGEAPEGQGGTGQIVAEAMRLEILTVWIQARAPHDMCVLVPPEPSVLGIEELPQRLRQLLLPPLPVPSDLRQEYFEEKQPRWTFGFLFRVFCDLFAEGKFTRPQWRLEDFASTTQAKWRHIRRTSPGLPQTVTAHIEAHFLRHYAWADRLADYYAHLYRSSFIAIYLLGGLAVLCALAAYALGWTETGHPRHRYELVWVALELFCILGIIQLYRLGTRRRWHDRWIDYRLLAEQLRQMRFLAPLGWRSSTFRVPAHDVHGDPRSTWITWHFRAIVREAGMVCARLDAPYRTAYHKLLTEQEIQEQITYHHDNAHRFHQLDHCLHWFGYIMFALTLLACLIHLMLGLLEIFFHGAMASPWLPRVLTVCAAVLPAFGAAIYGIRSQGEFQRITKRSEAMSAELSTIKAALTRAGPVLSANTLGQASEQVADIMTAEVLDWRIVFQERPLVLPG
jgi:hypothetical protein